MKVWSYALFGFFFCSVGWGRVFNINNEKFAPYVVLGGSGSGIATKPFQAETSGNLNYSGGHTTQWFGEFGFLYTTSLLNFRFGFEILKPPTVDIKAANATADLYNISSEILGYVPKVGIEANLHGDSSSRSFLSLSYGTATVTFKNDYKLTSAGQAVFPGVTDYSTELKGSTSEMAAALGYEGFLSDSTTLVVEFGYKRMMINNWSYTKDVSTLSGSYSAGDSWVNTDGAKREIDFSGAFITLGFRIYL